MMTKIDERKNIIVSLKSNYGERKKGIEKRVKYLKGVHILSLICTILCGGIIILSIILEPLGFEFLKWQKMSLLTILSLNFILRLPRETFELKLLKHLKKISDKTDFSGIEKLNLELNTIVADLNNKMRYHRVFIALALVILILAMVQVLWEDFHPYWNYAKILVILFFGMVLSRFYMIYKKLNRNIKETEKHSS